jgi:hypothetical protein
MVQTNGSGRDGFHLNPQSFECSGILRQVNSNAESRPDGLFRKAKVDR